MNDERRDEESAFVVHRSSFIVHRSSFIIMSKSASAPRSSFSARLGARVKVFSASLSDQAVIDAGVGLFIIVALSILLLRDYQRPRIDQLPAGSVASSEIIAPED